MLFLLQRKIHAKQKCEDSIFDFLVMFYVPFLSLRKNVRISKEIFRKEKMNNQIYTQNVSHKKCEIEKKESRK